MIKQGKVWGETQLLLKTPLIEVHLINIKPNSFCSMHKHLYKWNAFFVIDGILDIIVEKNDYNLVDRTILHRNQFTTVKPGEFHQFQTGRLGCEALEIYYCEGLSEDIIRKSVGGIDKPEDCTLTK